MNDMPAVLSESELNFFVDANCRFFDKVAPNQLVLKDPSIEFSEPVFLDFTASSRSPASTGATCT